MSSVYAWILSSNFLTIIIMCAGGFALHTAATRSTVEALKETVQAYKELSEVTKKKLDKIEDNYKQVIAENTNLIYRIEGLEAEANIHERRLEWRADEVKTLEEIMTISSVSLPEKARGDFDKAVVELERRRADFRRKDELMTERRKIFHPSHPLVASA